MSLETKFNRFRSTALFSSLLLASIILVEPLQGKQASIGSYVSKKETSPLEKSADSKVCCFVPPQGWDIVDPQLLSKRVQIGFINRKADRFSPSINLAIEKVDVSQAEYIKAVKNIHESNRENRWRQLGKVQTAAGIAVLTEIDSVTEWGPVRMLQLILVKDKRAFVLTAAALKEEIPKYYKDFQSSFRSLQLTDDLLSNIPQLERREQLKQAEQNLVEAWKATLTSTVETDHSFLNPNFQKKHWDSFQELVTNHFKDMGTYWQILLLKSAHEKLLSSENRVRADKEEKISQTLDNSLPTEIALIETEDNQTEEISDCSSREIEASVDFQTTSIEAPFAEKNTEVSKECLSSCETETSIISTFSQDEEENTTTLLECVSAPSQAEDALALPSEEISFEENPLSEEEDLTTLIECVAPICPENLPDAIPKLVETVEAESQSFILQGSASE